MDLNFLRHTDFNYENVMKAISILYESSAAINTEEASSWLGKFQRSIYSWQVCNDILLHNKNNLNAAYFAAQTMRSKIKYQFQELPPDTHLDFKKSLFDHLLLCESLPQVATQLCLAVADLALQMVKWKNAIADIINTMSQSSQHLINLLEILQVIPEELNSSSLRLGKNRLMELLGEWEGSRLSILDFFASCMNLCEKQTPNDKTLSKIFSAFGQWWTTGGCLFRDCDFSEQPRANLFYSPWITLQNTSCSSQLHEAACDCICNIIYSWDGTDYFPTLSHVVIEAAFSLEPMFRQCISSDDFDRALNIARVWSELGETIVDGVADGNNVRVVDLLLLCVSQSGQDMALLTFNCWYLLVNAVMRRTSKSDSFQPYFEKLLIGLTHHCCFEDADAFGNADFQEFRERVAELVEEVMMVLPPQRCLHSLFELVRTSGSSWDMTEAVLFVLSIVVADVEVEEAVIQPQLLSAVLQLGDDSPIPLLFTGVTFLGKLSSWVNHHRECLGSLMPMVMKSFSHPKLATAAAQALSEYCSHCLSDMKSQFQGLLSVAEALPSQPGLKPDAINSLLKGVVQVISKLDNQQERCQAFTRLCAVQVQQLETVLATGNTKSDPCLWLDCLSTLFMNFTESVESVELSSALSVMQMTLPVLDRVLDFWSHSSRVVERGTRVFRYQIRCTGKQCAPILDQLATIMMTHYAKYAHSCFLYLGGILVDEFGGDVNYQPVLLDMMSRLMGPTIHLLSTEQGMSQNPDVVEDLFRLCTRFIQRCPKPFLVSPAFGSVVQLAISSLPLEAKNCTASVTKFLAEGLMLGTLEGDNDLHCYRSSLSDLLAWCGAPLTNALISSIVLNLSEQSIPDIAEVLYYLHQLDATALSEWLKDAILALPNTRADGLVQATQRQIEEFHSKVMASSNDGGRSISTEIAKFTQLYR